jgi:hypothetical protein
MTWQQQVARASDGHEKGRQHPMTWIDDLRSAGDHATKVKTDLPYFAQSLRIRPKTGSLVSFTLNPAQLELHKLIEEQKAKTGRVRVVVLKARQMGVSTYAAARFYHRTISNPGLRTIIIGHKVDASRNLFQIVKRFHDHLPEDLRPSIGVSNAEELVFDKIDSGYLVTVATTEGAGRSATAQMLHGSETAFWPDLPTQLASVMQTVPIWTAPRSLLRPLQMVITTSSNSGGRRKLVNPSSCRSSCPGLQRRNIVPRCLMTSSRPGTSGD